MKYLLPTLAMVLTSPTAMAGCWENPPPIHGEAERASRGLSWHARPVCYRAEFVVGAVTLDADAREALAQRLAGARRLYGTDCVAVVHGPELPDHDERRVAYLRWWLGLQNVRLYYRKGYWEPDGSGDILEVQVEPCHALSL